MFRKLSTNDDRPEFTSLMSSLCDAVSSNDEEAVRDILYNQEGNNDVIMLVYASAVQNGNPDIVRHFIESGHVQVNDLDLMFGETALMHAVRCGRLSVVNYLLQIEADINFKSSQNGVTALHVCVSGPERPQNNWEILNCLLENTKIDLEARNNDGQTPLIIASNQAKVEEVKRLLEGGCDMYAIHHRQGQIAAHFCMSSRYFSAFSVVVDCFRLFLENRIDPDFRDTYDIPFIGYAINTGIYKILCLLIYSNCDIHILYKDKSETSFPPFVHACQRKQKRIIETLFAAGCDVDKWRDIVCADLDQLNLSDIGKSPRTLKQLCRIIIRRQIGHYPHLFIDQLGLPKTVSNYILLKDVIDVELS
ncbi:POTE ankyrin domain family member B-like [Mytilus trossulus]|uniref:POTE ankyrin domain family member B-like n=1 Tax=Mytilus trossulus TaxID=6551 RepID=UPI003004D8FF